MNKQKFKAMIRRSDSGKDYRVEYIGETNILKMLADCMKPLPKKGEKAFALSVKNDAIWVEIPKKMNGIG